MKKILLSSLLLLACYCGFAQDKKAILNVLRTQQAAWNRGDVETFMQGYWKSDSLVFVGHGGATYGYQQTLNNYKKSYPGKAGMGELSFTFHKVELLSSKDAFVLGEFHLKRENDAPSGWFTLWFKKIDGVWKIVCDHSS